MWTGSGQEGARSAQRHYEREVNILEEARDHKF